MRETHKAVQLTPASSSWRQHVVPSIKTQQVLAHFHITYCHWHRGLLDDHPGLAGEAAKKRACELPHTLFSMSKCMWIEKILVWELPSPSHHTWCRQYRADEHTHAATCTIIATCLAVAHNGLTFEYCCDIPLAICAHCGVCNPLFLFTPLGACVALLRTGTRLAQVILKVNVWFVWTWRCRACEEAHTLVNTSICICTQRKAPIPLVKFKQS